MTNDVEHVFEERFAAAVERAVAEVRVEVFRAAARFATLNSPHEGYAVIAEELDELWDEVKANTGRDQSARSEAMQVAAMAVRYMVDLSPRRNP